jgi:hypothetical protein
LYGWVFKNEIVFSRVAAIRSSSLWAGKIIDQYTEDVAIGYKKVQP